MRGCAMSPTTPEQRPRKRIMRRIVTKLAQLIGRLADMSLRTGLPTSVGTRLSNLALWFHGNRVEHLLTLTRCQMLDRRFQRAFETLVAANVLDPGSRLVALQMGLVLDELGMCSEAYEWLCRAAHAVQESDEPITDRESDATFWRELGLFCLRHDVFDEAHEVAVLATLTLDVSGGVHQR